MNQFTLSHEKLSDTDIASGYTSKWGKKRGYIIHKHMIHRWVTGRWMGFSQVPGVLAKFSNAPNYLGELLGPT